MVIRMQVYSTHKSSITSITFCLEQGQAHLWFLDTFNDCQNYLIICWVQKVVFIRKGERAFLWLLRDQAGQIDHFSIAQASWEIIKLFEYELSWLPFPIFFPLSLLGSKKHGSCPVFFPRLFLIFPPPAWGKSTKSPLMRKKYLKYY